MNNLEINKLKLEFKWPMKIKSVAPYFKELEYIELKYYLLIHPFYVLQLIKVDVSMFR